MRIRFGRKNEWSVGKLCFNFDVGNIGIDKQKHLRDLSIRPVVVEHSVHLSAFAGLTG